MRPSRADIDDVARPIFWLDRATGAGAIKLGLILVAVMLLLFFLDGGDATKPGKILFLGAFIALGLGLALWGAAKSATPGNPYLALSSEGLYMSPAGGREFVVPWSAISAVDLTDFEARVPGNSGEILRSNRVRLCKDVTAVSIPKALYETMIHETSLLKRGPGWENVFADRGEVVKIILHAQMMDADPQDIFRAVETRWQTFRSAGD